MNFEHSPNPVVVVISDLHANATALKAVLKEIESQRVDRLVILGDLLTYGMDVQETLDLVQAKVEAGAILILGNHDQLYLDLIKSNQAYYNILPNWIQESVTHTFSQLNITQFSRFNFLSDATIDSVMYGHANPTGSWAYLNSLEELQQAVQQLSEKQLLAGIFGHTHRSLCFSTQSGLAYKEVTGQLGPWIINSGSIGQPRNKSKPNYSSYLCLTLVDSQIWARINSVIYDTQEHSQTIIDSKLTNSTKNKLLSFFN